MSKRVTETGGQSAVHADNMLAVNFVHASASELCRVEFSDLPELLHERRVDMGIVIKRKDVRFQ